MSRSKSAAHKLDVPGDGADGQFGNSNLLQSENTSVHHFSRADQSSSPTSPAKEECVRLLQEEMDKCRYLGDESNLHSKQRKASRKHKQSGCRRRHTAPWAHSPPKILARKESSTQIIGQQCPGPVPAADGGSRTSPCKDTQHKGLHKQTKCLCSERRVVHLNLPNTQHRPLIWLGSEGVQTHKSTSKDCKGEGARPTVHSTARVGRIGIRMWLMKAYPGSTEIDVSG